MPSQATYGRRAVPTWAALVAAAVARLIFFMTEIIPLDIMYIFQFVKSGKFGSFWQTFLYYWQSVSVVIESTRVSYWILVLKRRITCFTRFFVRFLP